MLHTFQFERQRATPACVSIMGSTSLPILVLLLPAELSAITLSRIDYHSNARIDDVPAPTNRYQHNLRPVCAVYASPSTLQPCLAGGFP